MFVLLSMVCTPIFTCFKCCCCCCKPGKKAKEFEKKFDPFKSLVVIIVFSLTIILLLGTGYWAINLHRTIDRSQPLMCSIFTMMHDIQHGYKDEKITFAGIGGVAYFLTSLKNDTLKLKNSPHMDNILNRKLDVTAKEFDDSITAFYNKYKGNTVKGCKPAATMAASNDVTPGVIKALTNNINDGVKTEKEQFISISNKVNNISGNVKKLSSGDSSTSLLKKLESFIKTLNTENKRFEDAKTEYMDKINYKKTVKWMRVILWSITGTMAFLLIFNLLIMLCTLHCNNFHQLNPFSKLLMTLKLTIGGAISSISITFMVMGIISSNFCALYQESMEDKSVLKGFLPEYPYTFAENCLYNDSKGDLSFLMNNLGNFGEELKKFDDLDKFKSLVDPVKKLDKSASLYTYKTEVLTKFRNFKNLDTLASGEQFKENLDNLNTKAQAIKPVDNYRLDSSKCPSDAEIYTKGQQITYTPSSGKKYCIPVPEYQF